MFDFRAEGGYYSDLCQQPQRLCLNTSVISIENPSVVALSCPSTDLLNSIKPTGEWSSFNSEVLLTGLFLGSMEFCSLLVGMYNGFMFDEEYDFFKCVVHSSADDPHDDFFGGSHQRGASRHRMGAPIFGFGGFPGFGSGFGGFNSGTNIPAKTWTVIIKIYFAFGCSTSLS